MHMLARRRAPALAIILLMFAAVPAAAARCTTDFVHMIGVAAHLDAPSTQYGDLRQVEAAINYLGIDRVRAIAPRSLTGLAVVQSLLADIDRLRLTLIVMGDPRRALESVHALAAHVDMVEGPNEVDRTPVRFQGLTGPEAVRAAQRYIYTTVHDDPALNGAGRHTPVLNFSLARADFGPYGDLAAGADLANVHAYAQRGVPPYWMVPPTMRKAAGFLARPVVITETNYPTLLQPDGNGVSEPVQAKWVQAILLDSFRNNAVATFIYQLMDALPDPGGHEWELHFGLFRFNNTPKPAATALHNMVALLHDRRPCADAPAPAYQVNLPHGAFDVLLARPDGSFVLVLWAEPVIWDAAHNTEIPAPVLQQTVSFPAPHDIRVYDPMAGQTPLTEQHSVDRVTVALSDHPVLIMIR